MAQKEDLFYKPIINDIDRSIDHTPEDIEIIKEYQEEFLKSSIQSGKRNIDGSLKAGSNALIDLYDSWIEKMQSHRETAKILKERSQLLMDISIEDLDKDVCSAPVTIKEYIEDLTGIPVPTDKTSADCQMNNDIAKCIFKTAGYYDSSSEDKELLDLTANDVTKAKESIVQSIGKMEDFRILGLDLLMIMLKLCVLIVVHYTLGYMCHFFKGKFEWKIVDFKLKIGDPISDTIGKIEKSVISAFGYTCSSTDGDDSCAGSDWEDVDIKKYKCCSTGSFLFAEYEDPTGKMVKGPSACLKRIIKMEMNENNPERFRMICSDKNSDKDLIPTTEDIQKAKYIADYLLNKPENKQKQSGSATNIPAYSKSIQKTNEATILSLAVENSIKGNKQYVEALPITKVSNCFGISPEEGDINETTNKGTYFADLKGDDSPVEGMPKSIVENGTLYLETIRGIDEAITKALETADRVVVSSSMLMKFSSSKQLCCWVYLYVYIGTMISSLVSKGAFCYQMSCDNEQNETGYVTEGCENALRNEMRWAASVKGSDQIELITSILKSLKMIVDMFIRKQKMAEFLQGIRLPIHDMAEEIKYVLMTGLSGYIDILLGPIDIILSSIRANEDMRNMINNECFGFLNFLDMLACMIGNIKTSILNFVGNLLNKSFSDFQILSDIYLSRTRLMSLEAFSKLLGNMINLILSLSDCYDPKDLSDKIVDKQIEDQYNEYIKYDELVGNRAAEVDACTVPLTNIKVKIDPEDGNPNSELNKAYDTANFNIGATLEEIVYNEMVKDNKVASVAFTKEDGKPLSRSEFITKIEEITGVTILEVKESMEHKIFDIIRSGFNA